MSGNFYKEIDSVLNVLLMLTQMDTFYLLFRSVDWVESGSFQATVCRNLHTLQIGAKVRRLLRITLAVEKVLLHPLAKNNGLKLAIGGRRLCAFLAGVKVLSRLRKRQDESDQFQAARGPPLRPSCKCKRLTPAIANQTKKPQP